MDGRRRAREQEEEKVKAYAVFQERHAAEEDQSAAENAP